MKFLKSEIEEFEIYEENEREHNAEKRNSRGRCWVGTWNNPKMTDEEFQKHWQDLYDSEILQFAVFQREKGEEKGTIHFQFFVNFRTPQYFSKLKTSLIPAGCHFAPMISSAVRCREYCSKVDTRISGPYEVGEFEEERQRTDLAKAIKMIDEGVPFEMVCKIFPSQSLQYGRQLKEREKMVLQESQENVFRQLSVTYIYGPPGIGKTREVMEKYGGYGNVYRVTFYDNRAFDAYRKQDVILFDEFRSSFKITDMLNFLDGYPLQLPCRYNDKPAFYTKVYIVSNIPLSKQYEKIQEEEPETYKAFLRRIHNVIRIDSNKIKHIEKQFGVIQEKIDMNEVALQPVEDEDMPF